MLKTARSIGLTWPMAAGLLALHLAGTLFEGIGLTILLPVFQMIQSGESAEALAATSRWWRYLVDAYGLVGLRVTVPVLLVTSFAAILGRQALIYLRLVYTAYVQFNLIRSVRDRAFRAFLAAALGYGETEGMGRIVNDLTVEAQVAVEGAMNSVAIIGFGLLCTAYLGLLLAISAPMTLAAIGVIVLALLPVLRLIRKGRVVGEELVKANSGLLNFLSERLKSARLIRLSGMEDAEYANMRTHTAEQYNRVMHGNILRARTTVMIEPFVVAAGFLFLYLGVTEFGLSIEQIGLFLVVVVRLLPVVKEMANVRYAIANRSGSLRRVRERLRSLETAHEADRGTIDHVGLTRHIRFEGVRFRYEGASENALDGIDLTIPAHRVTALVGPSGGGKSTLIDLLPRLRVPAAGRILIDDIPLEQYRLPALRAAISYAPQSPQLFNVTVREHIHYGQPEADMAAIVDAAKLAGAHGFISRLAHGYDTAIAEAGAHLSGGQRQRLDLARALLKPARILILDEPTSQLDADAEHHFREALQRIRRETDLTVIIVGHRFSTVSMADRIVVLRDGRIEDMGSHAELMQRTGWYARAYESQNSPVVAAAD